MPHYRKALEDFSKVVGLQPRHSLAWENQGSLLHALGRRKVARGLDAGEEFEKALLSYARAREIEPADWKTAFQQASLLEQLGRFEEALESYIAARSLQPGSTPVQEGLRRCLEKLGRDDF
jgi:tetratricopeptide (TPR) repeat protein